MWDWTGFNSKDNYSKNLSLESQDELYQDKLMQISTDNLVWNAVCALHQQKLNNDLYIFLSLAPKNINTFYTEGFFIAHYAWIFSMAVTYIIPSNISGR